MPLPFSAREVRRLGKRIAACDTVSESDERLLASLLAAYREAVKAVRDDLGGMGFEPNSRLKTTGTMRDKLLTDKTVVMTSATLKLGGDFVNTTDDQSLRRSSGHANFWWPDAFILDSRNNSLRAVLAARPSLATG